MLTRLPFFTVTPRRNSLTQALGLPCLVVLLIPTLTALAQLPQAQTNRVETTRTRRGWFARPDPGVYKARITPHWFHNSTQFWYRNDLKDGAREFILVDALAGLRRPAFDRQKLAVALSAAAGQEFKPDHLPFRQFEFGADAKTITFEAAGKNWRCDLGSYTCTFIPGAASSLRPAHQPQELQLADLPSGETPSPYAGPGEPGSPAAGDAVQAQPQPTQGARADSVRGSRPRFGPRREFGTTEATSPDGKWTAFVKDYNVYLRSSETELQLSKDGSETNAYGHLAWAPDSAALVAWRIEPGDHKEVYLIRSSPPGGGRAQLEARPYAQAGDKFPRYEPNIFLLAEHKQLKPDVDPFEHEWERPDLHWSRDGTHFAYEQVDRGHQRLRVIDIDSRTGAVRNLVDEQSKTFIWTAHTENLHLNLVNWLQHSDELIYVSEQDGWRHLYLFDAKAGRLENQITQGQWVVRGIDRIDEDKRQVWFNASGMYPDQDPYFLHYYRINFDGTGLVHLTDGNGNHSVQFSPDRRFLIDTFSRVDSAPVHVLRRTSDGARVCDLETADISELEATGWKPPEVFVAKGRDGKTDIWGIICRPRGFNPDRKYPVLESIYAGPQGSYVPKSFTGRSRFSSLTDLGFVVVQMDGMGTANRSKAFHDVCWKNLKDAGFPDRILWHKAVAAKYPWYDLSRVGLYGVSAGGQSAAGGVLFHPEFYKAAVAACGCHDNRLDKASWNEQWMGYATHEQLWSTNADNWYSQSSNIDNAWRLQGKLLLIVGEMDHNVPPESTLRFVDALIKAGKDFEMLVVPGADHGLGGAYGQRRLEDFFVRNLLHKEPPDHNRTMAARR
jgi:dipeptidyl aminopeptidase/acylaminoacyl peptidase